FQSHLPYQTNPTDLPRTLLDQTICQIYLVDIQTTPYAILGLLAGEPMAGYDIRREIEESLSFFWSESYGQIYPALKRLEAARLIAPVTRAQSGTRRRRVFRITALGEAKLRAW